MLYIYWTDTYREDFPPLYLSTIPEEKVTEIQDRLNAQYGEGEMKRFVVSDSPDHEIDGWYYFGEV